MSNSSIDFDDEEEFWNLLYHVYAAVVSMLHIIVICVVDATTLLRNVKRIT